MRIIYLDIDTLRPDHLGCYGYLRDTSPAIDSIAGEGTLFEQYYCSDAPCLPSRAACYTARFGIHNGAVGHGGSGADLNRAGADRWFRDQSLTNGLFYQFRQAGLYTASISTFAERHSSYWYCAGFREVINVGEGGMESAETVMPYVERWLREHMREDDWLLHVNLWDAHTPYRVPMEEGNYFANAPIEAWYDGELEKHLNYAGPHGARDLDMYADIDTARWPRPPAHISGPSTLKRFVDGYDCGIRYIDKHIERIVDLLKQAGIYEDVGFVITSDHGENLGELCIYGEHATADYSTCRIPLIVKWPGCPSGQRKTALHYNIDLTPTLCELLGNRPDPVWDGISFAGDLRSRDADRGRDYLVLSQCAHVCQRAVRFGDYLYIRTYHDGLHPFPPEMLFQVSEDPHETRELSAAHPELLDRAARLYLDWLDRQLPGCPGFVDPLYTVLAEGGPFHAKGNERLFIGRLRETGRSEAADRLEAAYFQGDRRRGI